MRDFDLAIVGAGPAGLTAAVTASQHGASVVVVDEQPAPGGQIFRQPPASFRVEGLPRVQRDLHTAGKEVLAAALGERNIHWLHETTAWGLFPPDEPAADDKNTVCWLAFTGPGGTGRLSARSVLLAPGAYDWPVAFPGWTLPGVMTAGGLQALVKSQKMLPGERFLLVGAHPLLLILADQLLEAGVDLAAVCFVQRRPAGGWILNGLGPLLRQGRKVAEVAGVLARLKRANVPLLPGHVIIAAEGAERVEGARLAPVDAAGRVERDKGFVVVCDTIALGFGFLASSELARQAGCRWRWEPFGGGWVVEHDRWFRSSVPSLLVAGEITGVAGAEVAMEEGRVAACGALMDLGILSEREAECLAEPARERLRQLYGFARTLQDLASFPVQILVQLIDDETVVCRCEGVRAGTVREALQHHPYFGTTSAIKLYTRAGMGPCQGRMCNVNILHLIAAETGALNVTPFNVRPPVKPVLIGSLLKNGSIL